MPRANPTPRPAGTTGRERGSSLVETVIVLAILAALVSIIASLVRSSSDAQKYGERLSRATEVGQEILGTVQRELHSSAGLFQNDAIGNAYLKLLRTNPMPLPSSTLPTIDTAGSFEREAASRAKTGNALLLTRHAWTTEFACASGERYRIDVYRILYYYLTASGRGPAPGTNGGLNLAKFVSAPLADGSQLDKIDDLADRAEVLAHLASGSPDVHGDSHAAVNHAWLRGEDPGLAGTFRLIDPAAGTMTAVKTAAFRLLPDPTRSSAGLLQHRHFSVASNYSQPSWGAVRFGVRDDTKGGFPHGFELQMVGRSSNRKVMMHLTIASTNRAGLQAHADSRTMQFVRDF